MTKVYSLDEAREWFEENASGNVICVKDGEEQECDCYPAAIKFYGGAPYV